ncbi:MAG: CHASE2 domain-containing protein, partial [Candidatus Omnitrophica bacterium]|nr:CHASE2 domain-containing protein [Candidatus Omnitrophota bacterium]
MNKKTTLKLIVGFSITFSLAIIFLLLARTKVYQIFELKALDLRFVLRGNRSASMPILHIDIDDQSLEKLGRWPWPRVYHARLIDTLRECQAKQIIFDILFMEEFKDEPQQDELLSDSMLRSGITYLPFYFSEETINVWSELEQLLLQDINISYDEAIRALKISPQSLKEDELFLAKRYVIDEVVKVLLRKEPDITLDRLIGMIEDSKGWFLLPLEESYLKESFASQKLSLLFINKFARDLPTEKWPFKKEYRHISTPIKKYIESIKGSGFINAEPDLDGITRRVPLFIKYEDKILPQLTLAALIDMLDIKGIEAKNDSIILKNAQFSGIAKDIRIPVDEKCSMLINWQGRWGYSFKHIPYQMILQLQDTREQLRVHIETAGIQ